MKSPEIVDKLKRGLEKSGTPLELRTKKVLRRNGFTVGTYHYEQLENGNIPILMSEDSKVKLGQLDIRATKYEKTRIELDNTRILFSTVLLGECKYSSNNDLFLFEKSQKYLPLFPFLINGHELLPKEMCNNFRFPIVADHIAEVNVRKPESREKGNYSDQLTYQASNQILRALSAYVYETRNWKRNKYLEMWSSTGLKEKWEDFMSHEESTYEELEREERFLKILETKDVLDKIRPLFVEIVVPIIIVSQDRGVLKVCLDEQAGIQKFEDVGFGIYSYVPSEPRKYSQILGDAVHFPIVISNLDHLDAFIKEWESGIQKIIQQAENRIKETPSNLIREIMFSTTVLGFR